ncbi:MAG: alpha/beta fold hydrolase [Isosphaeraceae bacterium]
MQRTPLAEPSARRLEAARKARDAAGFTGALMLLGLLTGCSDLSVHQRKTLDRLPGDLAASITPPPGEPLALVQTALARQPRDPYGSIAACGEAALRALPYVVIEGVSERAEPAAGPGAQATYRRAIEYALLAAHRQAQEEGKHWTEVLRNAGIGVRGQIGAFAPEGWADAIPARAFEVAGLRHKVERGGLGAPVVLSRRRVDEQGPLDRYFPGLLYQGATAMIRAGNGLDEPPAILELHDPVREVAMQWQPYPDAPMMPLAYDMTTPLARQFVDTRLNLIGVLGVLFPSEFDGRSGLYMIDPYQPGKIPIVFVHGLMSSPEAWTNAMNELRGDPALRERYQFWMFFYSTGNPILRSASRLRQALAQVRLDFDPGHQDPALDQMVLVGHSMGGVLSRLAVSSSGDDLWDAACRLPPDQLDIDANLKKGLISALFFDPVPSVRRAIFIATPHQGSPMGDQFIGRLGASLIALPSNVTDISKAMLNSNAANAIAPIFRDKRQLTSIAQLGQKNPVLKIVNTLPIEPGLPYHSIVGYNGRGPLETGGDGIVPYQSAHIEGARSELVVLSDHSAQEHPETISELRRILVDHYREATGEARAPGPPTPIRYALEPTRDGHRSHPRIAANPGLLLVR